MKIVFISLEACSFFQVYGPPPAEWFTSFSGEFMPLPNYETPVGDVVVVTPAEASSLDNVPFTALIAQEGFLKELRAERRPEAFNRILRLVQSVVDQGISIPALWKPYNADSLIAVQTNSRASGEKARLLFDRRTFGDVLGVCYGVIGPEIDLVSKVPRLLEGGELQRRLAVAKKNTEGRIGAGQNDSFDLEVAEKMLGLGDSLQTWYESKLTTSQRSFADFALSKSVRVRGPAGSGKTVAMVVKLLRQLEADRLAKKASRYAFLTHSEATVELVRSMMRTMISDAELSTLTGDGAYLYVGTLYAYAYDLLGTELRGLNPLSLDGRLGRELQRELLESVYLLYLDRDWIARRGGCSDDFVSKFEAAKSDSSLRDSLLFEVLNEFACVLEPEGISRSTKKREEYVQKTAREPWRLQLSTPDERRVVLDLHAGFRREMREVDAISVDQLIADFERFLDSNAWEISRETSGFDAIFVDELHLLNRMERMLVTSLLKDADAKPVVVMAEDIKQDTRRVGFGLRGWQQQFEELKDFQLDEVFRYTPQINDFLRAIDDFAPTLHLDEDWPNYMQKSQLPSGPKPDVKVFSMLRQQYEAVFSQAGIAAKRRKNGRAVAVLTCDYACFKQYLAAGQHRELFLPVESREDITAIPSRGTKFVLSMPEFVAGLQFEEVFLIDVSANVLASGESLGLRDKRRGLSTAYLGSSRAMQVLHLSALREHGGLPAFVQHALDAEICAVAK